ncbi:MAG: GGDEF domain-containing protein [Rhodocyclaceae bacterium]|nr:MAG: GGDEF domain-containing protein [Rhodocyclaceae bacterium]
MAKPTQPSEIARDVLRQLALNRTPPTPDNYLALYHEISGTAMVENFPEKTLKNLAADLPRKTAEQVRFARQIETAVAEKSWTALKSALQGFSSSSTAEPLHWPALIRDLTLQLERTQVGLTSAKKREAIEHVIQASSTPELLFPRLQSLLRSWSQGQTSNVAPALAEGEVAAATEASARPGQAASVLPAARAAVPQLDGELQELIAQLLENSIEMLLVDTPDLAQEATRLAAEIRAAHSAEAIASFTTRMKKFSYRLQFVTEDQAELKTALLHLLQLIIENISELAMDDQWLHGQIAMVLELFNQPLNLRQLDDVERRMKEVIYKQSNLKKHLSEAQDRLKAMLATFVDRLADLSESTSGYHDKIERCVEKIGKASDIAQLSDVLDEVMRETRVIQLNAQRSRDELKEMRQRVEESEKEVSRLQGELEHASEMVRHDALTGALNRKGMNEVLEREVAHANRHGGALCIAMLDIDNFKKLNDSHGHHVGDDALVHLAKVTRETIRPQDSLARYGGEEFVIMLPETTLNEAVQTITRVQRELTRKFFLNKNEKLLITFSAGVAEKAHDEPVDVALKRADAAMYLAKRSGKNRVVPA